ncbi:hypothetical protein CDV31_006920 [Fusarium ambrosium]|uniref:Uncharacterized protein n=1 Tax=Fusarium ambrosium TaxID=131363 RepID=A0A428UAA2_9HYPO|nr:hypothetical protein CDV31_006920 [Fusarium ambrosium]
MPRVKNGPNLVVEHCTAHQPTVPHRLPPSEGQDAEQKRGTVDKRKDSPSPDATQTLLQTGNKAARGILSGTCPCRCMSAPRRPRTTMLKKEVGQAT